VVEPMPTLKCFAMRNPKYKSDKKNIIIGAGWHVLMKIWKFHLNSSSGSGKNTDRAVYPQWGLEHLKYAVLKLTYQNVYLSTFKANLFTCFATYRLFNDILLSCFVDLTTSQSVHEMFGTSCTLLFVGI
jgi:hypothetical protein